MSCHGRGGEEEGIRGREGEEVDYPEKTNHSRSLGYFCGWQTKPPGLGRRKKKKKKGDPEGYFTPEVGALDCLKRSEEGSATGRGGVHNAGQNLPRRGRLGPVPNQANGLGQGERGGEKGDPGILVR